MNDEPSVLDYVKSKLNPWGRNRIEIPAEFSPAQTVEAPAQPQSQDQTGAAAISWPWRTLVALGLALVAQRALNPGLFNTDWVNGTVLYALSALWLVWALLSGELRNTPVPEAQRRSDSLQAPLMGVIAGAVLSVIAFAAFSGNQFTPINVLLWALSFTVLLSALWQGPLVPQDWPERLKSLFSRSALNFSISRWTLLLIGAAILVIFFRTYQLNGVPPEMNSDHAEKLYDVMDVLNGDTRIFFPRNTGREAFQFYLTAAVASLFGTGISFTSLKIGTVLAGLVTLPFIYLLGKEIANRQVGLWAMVFAGIAYWPNVFSRIALRFSLYPLFAAPALYFLIRGLRRSNRNDFILSGIALGIGLQGYTATRILPLVVVAAVGIFLIHHASAGIRRRTLIYLALLVLFAVILALPLLRFTLSNPEVVAFRSLTRLANLERPLPDPAWSIFLKELWEAEVMPFWSNGEIWLHSVPYRPALDIVSAALYFIGSLLLVVRYIRQRHWLDLFLPLSVPLLMLPSILSLAFPGENPSLNRTGGAIIPVFIIVGIAMHSLLTSIRDRMGSPTGSRLAVGLAVILLAWSSLQNYDLVFRQYREQYQQASWNTSEIGKVIRDFSQTIGSPENAWVVPFPHWVDTRLVGINAGYPGKDYALSIDQLPVSLKTLGPKLFIVKPEDEAALQTLLQLYPRGSMKEYQSQLETKNFMMYFVPPE